MLSQEELDRLFRAVKNEMNIKLVEVNDPLADSLEHVANWDELKIWVKNHDYPPQLVLDFVLSILQSGSRWA